MTTRVNVESDWIGWARHACVTCLRHTTFCIDEQRALRLAAPDRADKIVAEGLRWPGYLGTRYSTGGILSVGIVHTDFATAGLLAHPAVPTAIAAHLQWVAGQIGDREWLDAIRSMYRAGLGDGGWTVRHQHAFYWRALGEDVDSIAYVNAVRCQWPGDQPRMEVTARCLTDVPLEPLLALLKPRLVLSNSAAVRELCESCGYQAMYIFQRNGQNLAEVTVQGPKGQTSIERRASRATVANSLCRIGLRREDAR